jgi:hypothetical protein
MDLGDHRDVGARVERLDRGAHPCAAGADDEDVVLAFHRLGRYRKPPPAGVVTRRRYARPVRAALSLLAAVAVGCSGGSEPVGTAATVPHVDVSEVATPVLGATARERRLLRKAIADFGGTHVRRFRFEPPDFYGRPGRRDLLLVGEARGSLRAAWETWVLAPEHSRRARAAGAREVVGLATGMRYSFPVGPSRPGARATGADARELAVDVAAAARAAGARLVEATVHRPRGLAVAIVLQVDDPAAFLHDRLERLDAVLPRLDELDGRFVAVLDASGRRAYVAMSSARGSTGGGWVDPRLRGCLPYPTSGVMSAPPPCPL